MVCISIHVFVSFVFGTLHKAMKKLFSHLAQEVTQLKKMRKVCAKDQQGQSSINVAIFNRCCLYVF